MTTDAARGALVALLSLPDLGPVRLRAIRARHPDPADAWAAVRSGRLRIGGVSTALAQRWRDASAGVDPAALLGRHHAAGVRVLTPEDADWPPTLLADPDPPVLLFLKGDASLLAERNVAVVGTRRCTAHGAATARELARALAAAGFPVVSGLALGVDGVAHRAALDAGGRPVGVVATGLDRVYPARHRDLWGRVAAEGVLVSEAALGVPPERWRFPCRNRLIAAFSSAVVVVESDLRGGSMTTASAALDRGVDVLAVPGPVRVSQSLGTNQLLFDGAGMVRDVDDLLLAVGRATAPVSGSCGVGVAVPGDAIDRSVAAVLSPAEMPLDAVVAACGLPVASVMSALARLEGAGVARRGSSGYSSVSP